MKFLLLLGMAIAISSCQQNISVSIPPASTPTSSTTAAQPPATLATSSASPTPAATPPAPEAVTAQSSASQPTPPSPNQAARPPEQPTFAGEIGHDDLGTAFSDFLFDHDGQIVYLDVYFSDRPDDEPAKVFYGEDWFTLWTECQGLSAGEAPSANYCTGISINIQLNDQPGAIWGYNQGFQYLKGRWLVTVHPGMHQGQLSLSLDAVGAN
ncbi:hypothetical protein [Almyronema epifaneia]|uniref:Lipoprotein n=1 Tax=Almyronema epifaneia S1 TaxID=2991925 RepID=A0ABW6IGI3_9CYAN